MGSVAKHRLESYLEGETRWVVTYPCALSTDTANLINHLLWTVENIATYSRLVKCKKEIPVRVTGHSGKKTRSNPFARRDSSELQLCDGLQWSDR
jgi:hypothetical protein